ncbi:MAG: Ig-like domain-containing protein [Dysgonomonas sp.]|nr:Ig-like domain-containing protein [Dysgonomonas sp.]
MRNLRLHTILILALTGCITFFSCEDKDFTTGMPEAKLIDEITIDNFKSATLFLATGTDSAIVWTISPAELEDKSIIWKSSDESVATVSEDGKITGISEGEAIITIAPAIGFGSTEAVKSIPVKVISSIVKATEITFTNTETMLYETDKLPLTYTISPENHTYDYLTWKSSDPAVATVSEDGTVTGVKAGEVTITAYTHDRSGVSANYKLTIVGYIPAENVEIKPYNNLLCMNVPVQLDVVYTPADATLGSVNWTSSNENIIKVDKGLLTPVGFGSVEITAQCKETGAKSVVSVTVDAGWYKWDATDNFAGWRVVTAGASSVIANGKMTVTMSKGSKWRGDIAYSGAPNLFGGNRPILAIKGTMPSAGSRKWDAVSSEGNSGGPNQTGTKTAKDGVPVYYYDMASRIPALATGLYPFTVFQFKMADFPIESSDGAYDVYWIRTFTTESDLDAFIAAE